MSEDMLPYGAPAQDPFQFTEDVLITLFLERARELDKVEDRIEPNVETVRLARDQARYFLTARELVESALMALALLENGWQVPWQFMDDRAAMAAWDAAVKTYRQNLVTDRLRAALHAYGLVGRQMPGPATPVEVAGWEEDEPI